MFRNRTAGGYFGVGVALILGSASLAAQTAPAAQPSNPDTPSIKVGVLLFADYTVQQEPAIVDADGNTVTLSAFQIGRAYINVTGNVSRTIAFRVTSDIVRETGTGTSLNGSYEYRLKYAFAQWNLDRHLTPGSFARFGLQPTPWLEMMDTVYRYRFQGAVLEDREGYLSPADAGAAFRYVLPGNHGDVHAGFYNGENYQHPEVNNEKAFQIRASVRPLPGRGVLNGLRVSAFTSRDAYVQDGERNRAIGNVTFEHPYVHAGFDLFEAHDRTSASRASVRSDGWTAFVTPISGHGWEGLLRADHLVTNRDNPGETKERTIAGIAYWFPHQGTVATALMFDVDAVHYSHFALPKPDERRFAVHSMVSF